MATFEDELLVTARLLIRRRAGQKGKIPAARIRRSISTSYYALFHFLLDDIGKLAVGATNDVKARRRILSRTVSHKALKVTLEGVRGSQIHPAFAEFFRYRSAAGTPSAPLFAQEMAKVFSDAQSKRHDADYNLQAALSARDAAALYRRIKRAMRMWRSAASHQDRDFKKALALLVLVRGQLRSENP